MKSEIGQNFHIIENFFDYFLTKIHILSINQHLKMVEG